MNSALESLGRVRVQGIVLLVVVFAIGALGGAAFMRARDSARDLPPGPPPPRGAPGPGAPGPGPHAYPAMLAAELQLTEEQREALRGILERHRPATERIMEEFRPRLRAVEDTVRAEIRAMLTPEQQKRFDEIEPVGRRAGFGPPPHGNGPPPGAPYEAPPSPPPGARPGAPSREQPVPEREGR